MIGTIILEFFRKYWKQVGAVVAVMALMAVSYALGRYVLPEKVVIQERVQIVEVEVERVVVVEKEVVQKVYVQNEQSRIHREKTDTKYPDGREESKLVEDINVDKVVNNTEVRYVDREVKTEVIKYVDREVEKRIEITKPLPDWRVTPMLGVDTGMVYAGIQGEPFDLGASIVAGGKVERRIWGPVFGGIWGLSSGQAGVSATLEF